MQAIWFRERQPEHSLSCKLSLLGSGFLFQTFPRTVGRKTGVQSDRAVGRYPRSTTNAADQFVFSVDGRLSRLRGHGRTRSAYDCENLADQLYVRAQA